MRYDRVRGCERCRRPGTSNVPTANKDRTVFLTLETRCERRPRRPKDPNGLDSRRCFYFNFFFFYRFQAVFRWHGKGAIYKTLRWLVFTLSPVTETWFFDFHAVFLFFYTVFYFGNPSQCRGIGFINNFYDNNRKTVLKKLHWRYLVGILVIYNLIHTITFIIIFHAADIHVRYYIYP